MIHSKNRPGFSLIEVLITIAMIAIILTPLFILQGSVLQSVAYVSKRIQRIFFAKQFLYEARKQMPEDAHQYNLEKKIEDPETQLKYELGPVDKKSSLHELKGMHIEKVMMKWQEERRQSSEIIVNLVYKPEKPAS